MGMEQRQLLAYVGLIVFTLCLPLAATLYAVGNAFSIVAAAVSVVALVNAFLLGAS